MGFFKKLWRGVKKVFKKIAPIIGIVASIAMPWIAPVVASAVGISSAVGTALVGAGLGAATGYLGGGTTGAILGGITGGIGGYYGAGGTTAGLLGGGSAAATPGAAGTLTTGLGGTTSAGLSYGSATLAPGAGFGAAGSTAAATGLGGAVGAASSSLPSIAQLGASLAGGIDVSKLAQLGMTMFGKSFTELTPSEKQHLQETAQLAATNKQLFEQKVAAAQSLIQQGVPNPEVGYAQGARPALLQEEERQRAMAASGGTRLAREASGRKGQIEAARMGTLGAYQETEKARANKLAGLQALTAAGSAPATASQLRLPIEEAQRDREAKWYTQVAGSAAGLLAPTYSRPATSPASTGGAGLFASTGMFG